jgi:hypothetical protein
MNVNADDPGKGRADAAPAAGGGFLDEEGPEQLPLPDRPWMTSINGADARSRLLAERAAHDTDVSAGVSPLEPASSSSDVLPYLPPETGVSQSVTEDGFPVVVEAGERPESCDCPPPSMKGYVAAAILGALSLVIIAAGLMIGWNLGQPNDTPVFRRNGSPGLLPVAHSAGEQAEVEQPAGEGQARPGESGAAAITAGESGASAGPVPSSPSQGVAGGSSPDASSEGSTSSPSPAESP